MANPRRRKTAQPGSENLRESVYILTSEMEEPLRHALQMVRLVALVDPHEDIDKEAIGFVAHQAAIKLGAVSDRLKDLFAACGVA